MTFYMLFCSKQLIQLHEKIENFKEYIEYLRKI